MMDPFAGIDMGDGTPAQSAQAEQATQGEQGGQPETHLEDTAFEAFALGDYTTLPVEDAMVTVEAAPEVDAEQLTRLQSVGVVGACEA